MRLNAKRGTITIRKYRRENARAASALISATFARFNASEGSPQAVRRYVEMYRPAGKKTEDIHLRLLRTPICFVAVRDARLVGVVRGTRDRLINLFVDGDHHRSGIATRLVRRFERACLDAGGTEIRVLGSLYATTFYQAIGYRKTTGVRNFHGLKVQPMKKSL